MAENRTETFRRVETDEYIVGIPRSATPAASLRLHGGVYDISRKAELSGELDSIEPHSDVVLDLGITECLDCSSIGVLIAKLSAWNRQKPGTKLHLRNVNSQLAKVLLILGLEHVFVLEPSAVRLFHHGTAAAAE